MKFLTYVLFLACHCAPLGAQLGTISNETFPQWSKLTGLPGADAQLVLNSGGLLTGSSGLTWNNSAGTLGVTGGFWAQPHKVSSGSSYAYFSGAAMNCQATGGASNALTCTVSPAPAGQSAIGLVTISVDACNTGAETLNINGLGTYPVLMDTGRQLVANSLCPNYSAAGSISKGPYTLSYSAGTYTMTAAQGDPLYFGGPATLGSITGNVIGAVQTGFTEHPNQTLYVGTHNNNLVGGGGPPGNYLETMYVVAVGDNVGYSSSSAQITAILAKAADNVASTVNWTGTGVNQQTGVLASFSHRGSGTVSQASGVIGNVGNALGTGGITDSSAFFASAPTVTGTWDTHAAFWAGADPPRTFTGSLKTRYGLRVDTLSGGTTNWGVWVQSNPSYFGGLIQEPLTTPASSSATCPAGQIWADANYVYVCTAADTIKRSTLSSF